MIIDKPWDLNPYNSSELDTHLQVKDLPERLSQALEVCVYGYWVPNVTPNWRRPLGLVQDNALGRAFEGYPYLDAEILCQ